jgi:hypothetical protein
MRANIATAPPFFFFLAKAYASAYHHLHFPGSKDVYQTTRHKTTIYINAYDSVCRIIYKTNSTCEGAMGVILYVCVGESERAIEEKIADNTERK